MTVPESARDAAHKATACNLGEPGWTEMLNKSPHDLIDMALDAAAPHFAAAGREPGDRVCERCLGQDLSEEQGELL